MTLTEYEKATERTDGKFEIGGSRIAYLGFALPGEVGELLNVIKKQFRGDAGYCPELEIKEELGDILWYLTRMIVEQGYSLEEIAAHNVKKTRERYVGLR